MAIKYLQKNDDNTNEGYQEEKFCDLIIESPNGKKFKIIVDENGVLQTEEIE